MNKSIYIITLILIVMLITACQSIDKKALVVDVKYSGALKTIMSGDIKPVISLESLSNKKHLYALGAVENLNGEIQIFNSNEF
jgi:hypothetical protein